MKKLLLFAAVLIAASCEGPEGPPGPPGEANLFTKSFVVSSEHWKFVEGQDAHYYYTFNNFPELTERICDLAAVNAYIYVGNDIQTALPYVRHYRNDAGDVLWTETIYCEYSPGTVTFFVNISDFQYDPDNLAEPGNKEFRVVLTR